MRKEIVSLGAGFFSLVMLAGASLQAQIQVDDQGWRSAPLTAGPTIVSAERTYVARSNPSYTRVVAAPVVAASQPVMLVPTRSSRAVNRVPIVPVGGSQVMVPAPAYSYASPSPAPYYSPGEKTVVMSPQACPAPLPPCPSPCVPYRVAKPVRSKYYFGRGLFGQPKLYVNKQPVRNALRWMSL